MCDESKIVLRNTFQLDIFLIAKEFLLKHKWNELNECMKLLNLHLSRNYINIYWKIVLVLAKYKINNSHLVMPQFLDCLKTIRLTNYNEIIYSSIVNLFSDNQYDFVNDILKFVQFNYTREEHITPLIDSIKSIIDYIEWKKIVSSNSIDQREYAQQLGERCIYQFTGLIEQYHVFDLQIDKLIDIYLYYEKYDELGDLLKAFCKQDPKYINAFKHLYKYQQEYDFKNSFQTLEKIAQLSPSDSLAYDYCVRLRDEQNDIISSIDSMFDMLDYGVWKFDLEKWNYFQEILLNVKRDADIKDCINGNWAIRKQYWPMYHFAKYKNNKINNVKVIIAALLLGAQNDFVKYAIKTYEFVNKKNLLEALEIHNWLICI